jgi:hypothetical protein
MRTHKQWKWGVVFSGENLLLEEIVQFSRMAEDAGAESLWSFEVYRDAFVPLTVICLCGEQGAYWQCGGPYRQTTSIDGAQCDGSR